MNREQNLNNNSQEKIITDESVSEVTPAGVNSGENLSVEEKRRITKEKWKKFGTLSCNAEDHKNVGGTPPPELLGENYGKALYEVMSDKEIVDFLNETYEAILDHDSDKNGNAEIQERFFVRTLKLLKSVGRLPEKYTNFELDSLE